MLFILLCLILIEIVIKANLVDFSDELVKEVSISSEVGKVVSFSFSYYYRVSQKKETIEIGLKKV